ncbi:MAG: AAA family ATPase [Treponemataceae bacterium]
MEQIIEQFRRKTALTRDDFSRSLTKSVQWDSRLIGIKGARGVGKTTLLLQHIKSAFSADLNKALYVSLDNLWFSEHSLLEAADAFVKRGGTHLFLDEVHKYPQWSQTIKNLYDNYPELYVVFTGSSLLEILNARADLSRRAVVYEMQGLSFREYLSIETGSAFRSYTLREILENHESIARDIVTKIKPFQFFSTYLQTGYYPYFLEGLDVYSMRLEETVNMILELELPMLRRVETAYIPKLKRLLSIISESAPFIPNISKLSDRIGINRQTLLSYLQYFSEAKLIQLLYKESHGIGALQKPDKLFLENTNLMYLFRGSNADTGNVRETFLANQLSYSHKLTFSDSGDFFVDEHYTIEVGGKNKTRKQIQKIDDAYIAADNLEYGYDQKIPLWLFGFLY